MVKLNFCANLSWMFKEYEFLKRYQHAADAGFEGVEVAWPYDHSPDVLAMVRKEANVQQILINTGGHGKLGSAANPEALQDFRDELELAIKYCSALQCKKLHIMAGRWDGHIVKSKCLQTYIENLKYASSCLKANGISGLIEPINSKTLPDYFLHTSSEAIEAIKLVDRPNIQYQLDLYHLQVMEGNLTSNIKNLLPFIGHIQISQVPGRNEPFSSGEINYKYIFSLLEDVHYDNWIGCEYNPASSTESGLDWFRDYCSAKSSTSK